LTTTKLTSQAGAFKVSEGLQTSTHSVCGLRFEQNNTVQRYCADRNLQLSINWLWSYLSVRGTVNRFLLYVSVALLHDWCWAAADV